MKQLLHWARIYTVTSDAPFPIPNKELYYFYYIFSPYSQEGVCLANNCRCVFASCMLTSRGTLKCCPEPLGIGIRFIAVISEMLGSYNEDRLNERE